MHLPVNSIVRMLGNEYKLIAAIPATEKKLKDLGFLWGSYE